MIILALSTIYTTFLLLNGEEHYSFVFIKLVPGLILIFVVPFFNDFESLCHELAVSSFPQQKQPNTLWNENRTTNNSNILLFYRDAKSYVDAHSSDLNRLQHFKESRIRVSEK